MKKSRREIMLGILADWEQYPIEFEIFLKRIADGASVTDMYRMHWLTGSVFFPWVESDPKRHQQYKDAVATRERLRLEHKALKKKQTAQRNEVVKLYFQMQGANQEVWEDACRLLKIAPAPIRPQR